jgi:hypothetical protein
MGTLLLLLLLLICQAQLNSKPHTKHILCQITAW